MKTNNKRIFFYLILTLTLSTKLAAHPTSFQGAWSIINETTSESRHSMFSYSHRYWLAFATHYSRVYLEDEGQYFEMAGAGVNTLLKRWNNPTSQGNVYLSLAQGREFSKELSTRDVTKVDLDADWEDRRYYIATAYRRFFRSNHDNDPFKVRDLDIKKLRLGFAPYLGEFDELNTWFITEFKQINSETIEVIPMLRFYYRNALWEIGSSLRGGWLFNFMLHL